jgi:putative hemin transport protein
MRDIMTDQAILSAAQIRSARAEDPKIRDRDLADKLRISEAQLVAAYVGIDVTRIAAHPDEIMPRLTGLGEVMALTRNRSCVIEKVGVFDNYRSGKHAAMVLNDAIDTRMFPSHWVMAFAIERKTDTGVRRSIQVFDAAGDAVHKIFLREGSDIEHWQMLVAEIESDDQSQTVDCAPRKPVEVAKGNPEKLDILRQEWAKMTDTHQFMRLTSKLRMNRLGAYRSVGAPFVRALEPESVNDMLKAVQQSGTEIMVFVGNMGCIEIHGGPIETLKAMGPWQNVLDPEFNLHLRADHIAEVWAVEKPTQRGPAISVEIFDAEGGLIFQVFGRKTETLDSRPAWAEIVSGLQSLREVEAV